MKFTIVQNLSSLVFFLLFIFPSTIQSQNFEYALSQQEFQFGKITQIELFDDKVLFGGSVGLCQYPTIWLFDTMGQFISYKILNIGDYEVGYVQSLQYEDTVIHALAYVQLGSDYGGASTYAWKLDRQLNVLEAKDLFGRDVLAHEYPLFAGNYITIIENNDIVIFDRNFEFVRRVPFYFGLFPLNGLLIDSILVLHEYLYPKSSSVVYSLDWQGSIISKKESKSILHIFNLGRNFFSLDENHIIRKHRLEDLTIVDSLVLPWSEGSEVNKISDNLFSLIHRNNNQTYTQIYDQDLNLIEEITSGLSFETELITKFSTNTIYQAGKYFSYRPQVIDGISYQRSIVPFVRKMSINNSEFSRQNIEIVHISLKNEIDPIRTLTNTFGEEFKDFYYMGPGQMLDYELTIRNNSDTVVTNFAYFTDEGTGRFCFLSNNYKYIDGIRLSQGEEITIRDTMFPYVIGSNRGLLFYAAAANHQLSDSAFSTLAIHDLSTSIRENNSLPGISIYPNPAQDFLSIGHPSHPSFLSNKVEIWSITGQILQTTLDHENQINIGGLSPGAYLLRLIDGKNIFMGSFIKIE